MTLLFSHLDVFGDVQVHRSQAEIHSFPNNPHPLPPPPAPPALQPAASPWAKVSRQWWNDISVECEDANSSSASQ